MRPCSWTASPTQAPFVYDTLVGFNHTISAPNQSIGANTYTFASWSDGGAQTHTIVVPAAAQTYTANFNAVAGDTTPPTVALTAPTAGTVSGTVTVSANAADNVGVAGVQFLVDNTALGAQDTAAPYSVSWNTTTATNGSHTLTALARDAAGNTTTSAAVPVTVANATTAPPAFVQVKAATPQTNQSSVAVTYTGAQAAGDTNVVVVGWNNTTSTVSSVTDTAGNAYQVAVSTARGSGVSQAIYYAPNIKAAAAGTNTVTTTFNTATPFVDVRALEYSGLGPFDVGTSASGTGASANSGTVTTTSSNALIVGAGTTTGGFSAAGTNFTTRIITAPDADIAEDRIVTAAGPYSATAPVSGAWVMQVAAFKPAAGSMV